MAEGEAAKGPATGGGKEVRTVPTYAQVPAK